MCEPGASTSGSSDTGDEGAITTISVSAESLSILDVDRAYGTID